MLRRLFTDEGRDIGRPRHRIGEHRYAADAHHHVGSDGRNGVGRIDIGEARQGRGIGRVQVHHGLRLRPAFIEGAMKRQFLGGLVARDMRPIRVELGQPVVLEQAEAGIGRRDEKAIAAADRDVA